MLLVGYVRVSGPDQVDGYGLDIQRRAIRSYAKTHGHQLGRTVYEDIAVSGTADALDRPGLSAALAEVLERSTASKPAGLVVARLDRLARALTVQEAALAYIWRSGGQVFTADAGEVLQDDPDDPMRTALRQVVGVFAELERRMAVKRMRDGRKAKAAAGRKAVGVYAYGYRGEGKGRQRDAAPNPEEQPAVELIKRWRREGRSYREIAGALDASGHRPRRAEHWSAMSVRSVYRRHAA